MSKRLKGGNLLVQQSSFIWLVCISNRRRTRSIKNTYYISKHCRLYIACCSAAVFHYTVGWIQQRTHHGQHFCREPRGYTLYSDGNTKMKKTKSKILKKKKKKIEYFRINMEHVRKESAWKKKQKERRKIGKRTSCRVFKKDKHAWSFSCEDEREEEQVVVTAVLRSQADKVEYIEAGFSLSLSLSTALLIFSSLFPLFFFLAHSHNFLFLIFPPFFVY